MGRKRSLTTEKWLYANQLNTSTLHPKGYAKFAKTLERNEIREAARDFASVLVAFATNESLECSHPSTLNNIIDRIMRPVGNKICEIKGVV